MLKSLDETMTLYAEITEVTEDKGYLVKKEYVSQRYSEQYLRRPDKLKFNGKYLFGNYEGWKQFISDAVEQNWPPCNELIWGNGQLILWEAYLGVGKVSSFPATVGFNVTDICNARCNFCAYAPERIVENKLTVELLRKMDWLKFCKVFRPNGGGLGEPLALPKIAELFEVLREIAPYIRPYIISNGSIMRPKLIKAMTGYVDTLYLSLNGASKKVYEETMPPLKWDRLISNLTALRDEKIAQNTKFPHLEAGFVVHKDNIEDLPNLPALLAELHIAELNIKPMVPPPSCSTSHKLKTEKDTVFHIPEEANEIFRALEKECAKHDIVITRPLPTLEVLRSNGRNQVSRDLTEEESSNEPQIRKPVVEVTKSVKTGTHNIITAPKNNTLMQKAVQRIKSQPISSMFLLPLAPLLIPTLAKKRPNNTKNKKPNEVGVGRKKVPMIEGIEDTAVQSKRNVLFKDGVRPQVGAKDVDENHQLTERWSLFMVPNGEDMCSAPWRTLKIDAFSNTRMCCSYFENLPKFEWPNAANFHNETGMWNHPFMQHIRSTMGKEDEIPFCTFCQGNDKSGLPAKEARAESKAASQLIHQQHMEKNAAFDFKSSLSDVTSPLPDWEFQPEEDKLESRPFKQPIHTYRRLMRRRDFWQRGEVLLIGVGAGALVPFLGEANEKLTIMDVNDAKVRDVVKLSQELSVPELDVVKFPSSLAELAFPDSKFDGIWIDGRLIPKFGRNATLSELRRVTKEGGRLQVANAPCVGELAEKIIAARQDGEPELAESLMEVLKGGLEFGGVDGFFGIRGLLKLGTQCGWNSDRERPPTQRFIGKYSTNPALGTSASELYENFSSPNGIKKVVADPALLHGHERYMTFTALAV